MLLIANIPPYGYRVDEYVQGNVVLFRETEVSLEVARIGRIIATLYVLIECENRQTVFFAKSQTR
jgi:hypothetical protein